jgi:hypothetical protein
MDRKEAYLVSGALQDVALELGDEDDLLVDEDTLQGFLNDPAAVHLQRQLQNVALERLDERELLVVVRDLERLLDTSRRIGQVARIGMDLHVVAEEVSGERQDVGHQFLEEAVHQ